MNEAGILLRCDGHVVCVLGVPKCQSGSWWRAIFGPASPSCVHGRVSGPS